MIKSAELTHLLKKRVVGGYYSLKPLPTERQLAIESGVSHMTARRAVKQLIDEGYLERDVSRRLQLKKGTTEAPKPMQIAFLMPDFASLNAGIYRVAIDMATAEASVKVRPVYYFGWDDPTIADSLSGFDGVFLLPSSEPIPKKVTSAFAATRKPLVVIGQDWTEWGVPSIVLMPFVGVQKLLDHLNSQGYSNIACFNAQAHDDVVEKRIEQWRIWTAVHGYSGQLIDDPVRPWTNPTDHAYEVIKCALARGDFDADACLCITAPAALALSHALCDIGLQVGKDMAICSVADELICAHLTPPITSLEEPDPYPFIVRCVDWMAAGGGAWRGPLLLQAAELTVVVRESTKHPKSSDAASDFTGEATTNDRRHCKQIS